MQDFEFFDDKCGAGIVAYDVVTADASGITTSIASGATPGALGIAVPPTPWSSSIALAGPIAGPVLQINTAGTVTNDPIYTVLVGFGDGFENYGAGAYHDFSETPSGRYGAIVFIVTLAGARIGRSIEFSWDQDAQTFHSLGSSQGNPQFYDVAVECVWVRFSCEGQIERAWNGSGVYTPQGVLSPCRPDLPQFQWYEGDERGGGGGRGDDYEAICLSSDGGVTTRPGFAHFDKSGALELFEADGLTLVADGATVVPCSTSTPQIVTICMCDDVAGDGSNVVSYVDAFAQSVIGTSVSVAFLGSFTDASLQTTYAPVNPADCGNIGSEAMLATLPFCDNGTTFYRVIDSLSGLTVREFGADGLAYTPVGPVTAGACAGGSGGSCSKSLAPHTIASGVGTPVPAGLKSVQIKATSGGVTVNGYPMSNGEVLMFAASESDCTTGILPAIAPVGGSWIWIALDQIEV